MSNSIQTRYRACCPSCSGCGETRGFEGLLRACRRCKGRGWVFALPGWTEGVQGRLQGWPAIKGTH